MSFRHSLQRSTLVAPSAVQFVYNPCSEANRNLSLFFLITNVCDVMTGIGIIYTDDPVVVADTQTGVDVILCSTIAALVQNAKRIVCD